MYCFLILESHVTALCCAAQVDVDRDDLPLGDYMWLVLPQDQRDSASTAAATAAAGSSRGRGGRGRSSGDGGASDGSAEEEEEEEEAAAAAERLQCLIAGAVVERKTVSGEGTCWA